MAWGLLTCPASPQLPVSLDACGWGPFITSLRGGILPYRSLTARMFFLVFSPDTILSTFSSELGSWGGGRLQVVTSRVCGPGSLGESFHSPEYWAPDLVLGLCILPFPSLRVSPLCLSLLHPSSLHSFQLCPKPPFSPHTPGLSVPLSVSVGR